MLVCVCEGVIAYALQAFRQYNRSHIRLVECFFADALHVIHDALQCHLRRDVPPRAVQLRVVGVHVAYHFVSHGCRLVHLVEDVVEAVDARCHLLEVEVLPLLCCRIEAGTAVGHMQLGALLEVLEHIRAKRDGGRVGCVAIDIFQQVEEGECRVTYLLNAFGQPQLFDAGALECHLAYPAHISGQIHFLKP